MGWMFPLRFTWGRQVHEGQTGLGILKLFTGGGLGIWDLIDWIIALTKLGKYKEEFVSVNGKWAEPAK